MNGQTESAANGGLPKEDTCASADVSPGDCSTSYHEASDISRADFKAIGSGFQVT